VVDQKWVAGGWGQEQAGALEKSAKTVLKDAPALKPPAHFEIEDVIDFAAVGPAAMTAYETREARLLGFYGKLEFAITNM
jgi:hypothetical protein